MQLMVEAPEDRRWVAEAEKIFGELAPYPVFSARRVLTKPALREFGRVSVVGEFASYVDESLWLPPDELAQLADEFRRLIMIAEFEVFTPSVTGLHLREHWEAWPEPALRMGTLLDKASQHGCWAHFML